MKAAIYGFGLLLTKMTVNENYFDYVYSILFLLLFFPTEKNCFNHFLKFLFKCITL